MASPHSSVSESLASVASYHGRVASTSLSPTLNRAPASHSSLGGGDLRLTFPYMRQQSITSSPGGQEFGGPAGRTSWELGTILPHGPALGMPDAAAAGMRRTLDYVSTDLGSADVDDETLPLQRGGRPPISDA